MYICNGIVSLIGCLAWTERLLWHGPRHSVYDCGMLSAFVFRLRYIVYR